MNCTANGKPLCNAGIQTRYEGGRGMVSYPCAICRTAEFEAVMKEWKPAEKPPEPEPAVAPVQQTMFESQTGYPE